MSTTRHTKKHTAGSSDLRSSIKRAVGIPETVEIVPPEGCAASDAPPLNTRAIRYWLVHDGRRLKRHRSLFAALGDPATRQRYSAVLGEVSRCGMGTLAPFVGVVAVLLVVWWLVAVAATINGVPQALLAVALVGFSLILISLMAASCLRLGKMLADSHLRHDLSHDEGTPLTVVSVFALIAGYGALLYLTVLLAALIVRLFAGVFG